MSFNKGSCIKYDPTVVEAYLMIHGNALDLVYLVTSSTPILFLTTFPGIRELYAPLTE